MRPENWKGNGGGEVEARDYLKQLHAWEVKRDQLAGRQTARRADLDAAEQRVALLSTWLGRLQDVVNATTNRADQLAVDEADVTTTKASIQATEAEISDFAQAHEIATARLLGGVSSSLPIVMLPLRLETHWDGGTLDVRIYPDVLSIDAHD